MELFIIIHTSFTQNFFFHTKFSFDIIVMKQKAEFSKVSVFKFLLSNVFYGQNFFL